MAAIRSPAHLRTKEETWLTRKALCALLMAVIAVSVASGLIHYQFFMPKIEGLTWAIVIADGRPALKVSFRTNVYPVLVRLLDSREQLVDEAEVSAPGDVPALLHLPLVITGDVMNAIPGTYHLQVLYRGRALASQDVEVVLAIELRDVAFDTEYFAGDGWYLVGLNLTVANTGNCPASFNNIKVEAEGNATRFWLSKPVTLRPGHTRSISVQASGKHNALFLGRSGPHNAKITLELGLVSSTKETVIPVPSPVLVVKDVDFGVRFDARFGAWVVYNVTLTVKNVGEGPAYIYSIEFCVPTMKACDEIDFLKPVVLWPGRIASFQSHIFIEIKRPGKHNVTVRFDMGIESWSFVTTLEIEAPVLVIRNASLAIEETDSGWCLKNVSVTIENLGNVTGYVLRIYVLVEGVGWGHRETREAIAPREVKTITAEIPVEITSPGTYNVTIKVHLGFKTLVYKTTLTVG